MPIVRYILFASSFVVALLILLDRCLPPLREHSAGPEADRTTIRIGSARALPERIIFDTSGQVAAAISAPQLAAEPADHDSRNALAMVEPRKPEPNITPASRHGATRPAGLHSNRTPRAPPSDGVLTIAR
jgi:hypothetical protein